MVLDGYNTKVLVYSDAVSIEVDTGASLNDGEREALRLFQQQAAEQGYFGSFYFDPSGDDWSWYTLGYNNYQAAAQIAQASCNNYVSKGASCRELARVVPAEGVGLDQFGTVQLSRFAGQAFMELQLGDKAHPSLFRAIAISDLGIVAVSQDAPSKDEATGFALDKCTEWTSQAVSGLNETAKRRAAENGYDQCRIISYR